LCDYHTIITINQENNYEFNGDPKTIPQPIRVMHGSSSASTLANMGFAVEDSTSNLSLIEKLLRDKNGSVILERYNAEYFGMYNSKTTKLIHLSNTQFLLKPSYYPFSKKSTISKEKRYLIWKTMASIGQNKETISNLFKKYFTKDQSLNPVTK